jgi:hypothetical protein
MFALLGTAVERLYGNNLGFEEDKPVLSLASDVLSVEQGLHEWTSGLPSWLRLASTSAFQSAPTALEGLAKRFQTITVVRYNYMRALIHRPVLVRLLSQMTEHKVPATESRLLRDVGQRSLDACVESSVDLISCVHTVCKARAQKSLLGTWWCSLYFSKCQRIRPLVA